MYSKQIKQNNSNLAHYKGSTRSEIDQKWAKMSQNWGFFKYFGHQTQLNYSLWIIYVGTQNNIMYSKQIKQNNINLAQYKGSTRSEIGQKWAKMCQNWGFWISWPSNSNKLFIVNDLLYKSW